MMSTSVTAGRQGTSCGGVVEVAGWSGRGLVALSGLVALASVVFGVGEAGVNGIVQVEAFAVPGLGVGGCGHWLLA